MAVAPNAVYGTFTAVGTSAEIVVPTSGELTFGVFGGVATVRLEHGVNNTRAAWAIRSTGTQEIAQRLAGSTPVKAGDIIRLNCVSYTSGTVYYTMTAPGAVAAPTPASSNAARRLPAATDDVNKGYAVGDLWQYEGSVYQNIKATAGKATWQLVPAAAALPVDAIGGVAPVAAYGMRLLRAAYTGKCINVVRASDGTNADIGFRSDGSLDTPALDAFLAGTTGRVAIWYDQSGAANNATGAAGSQPTVTPSNLIGNSRSIVFDTIANATIGLTSTLLTIPVGVAASTLTSTMLYMTRSLVSNGNMYPVQWSGATSIAAGYNGAGSVYTLTRTGANFVTDTTIRPTCSPELLGWSVAGGSSRIIKNGKIVAGPQTFSSTAIAGGTIGEASLNPGAHGLFDIGFVLAYVRSLTDAELMAAQASIHAAFRTVPQARDVLANCGDSITFGTGSQLLQNYPRKVAPMIDMPVVQYNIGRFGDQIANMAANFPTIYSQMYNPSATNNIMTIFAGTNDISSGATAVVTFQALVAFCVQARAAGWKIVVGTMLPRSSLSVAAQGEWSSYNSMIRAQWATFADGLADIQADDTLGPFAASSNTALLFDGTHPTDLGYTYIAPIIAAAIKGVMV